MRQGSACSVIVRLKVPLLVLREVVMVSVDAPATPETVTEGGLNAAEENFGSPATVRLTLPLNPAKGVTVIV